MMAADAPPPLYHGTRAPFGPRGGLLLPGNDTGRTTTHGAADYTPGSGIFADVDPGAYVYVTTDFDLAAEFARRAPGRGRPRVLTVRPHGPLEDDPATYGGERRADVFRTCSATVTARTWVEG